MLAHAITRCEPFARKRSNLMLTSMEGKTSGWQDSLLNPANTKYAMEVIRTPASGNLYLIYLI